MENELVIFLLSSILSVLAGFAYIYRTKETAKLRDFLSVGLNTGLCGLAISMIWYYKFKDQIYILIGFCILVGLMGPIGVEWVLNKFKSGGLTINFNKDKGELNASEK